MRAWIQESYTIKREDRAEQKVNTHGGRQLKNGDGRRSQRSQQKEIRGFVNLPLIRLALPGALMPAAPSVAIVAMGWIGWEQSSQ